MKVEDLTLDVEQHIDINAAPEKVFTVMLNQLGQGQHHPFRRITAVTD